MGRHAAALGHRSAILGAQNVSRLGASWNRSTFSNLCRRSEERSRAGWVQTVREPPVGRSNGRLALSGQNWHARKGSNPQPLVLGTSALPIELRAYGLAGRVPRRISP